MENWIYSSKNLPSDMDMKVISYRVDHSDYTGIASWSMADNCWKWWMDDSRIPSTVDVYAWRTVPQPAAH